MQGLHEAWQDYINPPAKRQRRSWLACTRPKSRPACVTAPEQEHVISRPFGATSRSARALSCRYFTHARGSACVHITEVLRRFSFTATAAAHPQQAAQSTSTHVLPPVQMGCWHVHGAQACLSMTGVGLGPGGKHRITQQWHFALGGFRTMNAVLWASVCLL